MALLRCIFPIIALIVASFAIATPAPGQRAKNVASKPRAGIVRVRLETEMGPITLALDTRRAPETTRNFLSYVDDGRFDGAVIYRVARSRNAPQFGFIQGGIRTDAKRILPPFPHERTDRTGITHLDGTISMARRTEPDSAGGNFFITVGAMPSFDAKGSFPGYAAFGRVIAGMPTVKRILALPTANAMRGQALMKQVSIRRAVRLDGKPQPTGIVKVWKEVPTPRR